MATISDCAARRLLASSISSSRKRIFSSSALTARTASSAAFLSVSCQSEAKLLEVPAAVGISRRAPPPAVRAATSSAFASSSLRMAALVSASPLTRRSSVVFRRSRARASAETMSARAPPASTSPCHDFSASIAARRCSSLSDSTAVACCRSSSADLPSSGSIARRACASWLLADTLLSDTRGKAIVS